MAVNSAYNWQDGNIKLWDTNPPESDFTINQGQNNAGYTYGAWKGGAQLAPYSQDWNDGYDATASDGRYQKTKTGYQTANVDTANTLWQKLLNHSNANFCNRQYYVPLFVNAIGIDLGISGSTAQARATRDFYPHNITIPSFTIAGQCYSTAHYGSLMEYIHMAQHQALNNTDLIQFYLKQGLNPEGSRTSGLAVTYKGPAGATKAFHPTQKIVGSHDMILCQGYINTIQRTHTTGNHRPSWEASFTVSQMIASPIYTEGVATEKETGTWLSILSGTKSQNWLNKQNETNNVKTLKSVKAGTSSALTSISNNT